MYLGHFCVFLKILCMICKKSNKKNDNERWPIMTTRTVETPWMMEIKQENMNN